MTAKPAVGERNHLPYTFPVDGTRLILKSIGNAVGQNDFVGGPITLANIDNFIKF